MKIKVLVGALVVLIVMNVAAIGAFVAVQMRGPRPPGAWRSWSHNRSFHSLDREKRRALFESMKEFREEARDLIDQTHLLEDEAVAAMGETPVPRARIDSLLQQIADNRLEIARQATDHMIKLGESLTPEERKQIMKMLMRRHGHRGKRHDSDDD